MNIDPNLAVQFYDNARRGTAAPTAEAEGGGFSQALADAARALHGSLMAGETAALNAATGKGDVQAMVEALSATEMALQTAVTVRDKVVEAYQEIMRMPV